MSDDRPTPGPLAEPTESAHETPRLPSHIGDFRIVRRLGAGGMGIVYEAEQQNPKRPVALKVIRGGAYVDEHQIKMFRREAQTLARLKHPSIAAIYEMGRTDDGQHFFAMELVRGETLDVWLKHHTEIDLRVRLGIFRKLCEAVAYAHQRGAIHRDLKPSNVLMLKESPTPASSPDAGIPDLKILDFGLARITDHDVAVTTVVSDAGTVRGTLPYMSPEQVLGNPDEIDLRTDVYSLGVILYELLTGKLPYDVQRKSLPEAVRIITEEPPAPLTKTWSGTKKLDADVATIAHKALEKEAARRYQSVAALVEDVQRYLADQPILAHRPSALYQIKKLVARHRYAAGVVVGAFVLLAAFGVAMAIQANRIAHERDRANAERDRANQEASTAKQVSEFLVKLFQVSDPSEARGNTITAREILDQGAERIERELKNQPATQARLMLVMGDVYRSLGLFDKARPLLERSLSIKEATFGNDSVELVETLNTLASLAWSHGRVRDARAAAERALTIGRSRLPPGDERLGWSLYRLGDAEMFLGRPEEARRLLTEARRIFEQALGYESLPVAWCLNDIAMVYCDEFDTERGIEFYEQALKLKEKLLPSDHPDLAIARGNLGYNLIPLGDYARAERLLRQALASGERSFGPDHPFTANTVESLGELAWKRGYLDEASQLLERALRAQEATLDPNSPYGLALTLHVLACVRRDQGRYREAEGLFERTLSIRESSVGTDHAQTRQTRTEYAKLLSRMGRTAEAETMEARARATPAPKVSP